MSRQTAACFDLIMAAAKITATYRPQQILIPNFNVSGDHSFRHGSSPARVERAAGAAPVTHGVAAASLLLDSYSYLESSVCAEWNWMLPFRGWRSPYPWPRATSDRKLLGRFGTPEASSGPR